MSTAEKSNGRENAIVATPAASDREVKYVPLGGKIAVELTVNLVRKFLCTPTRQGNHPSDQDVMKFMMLCRARELDPWVGDAYLTGYDTQDGPTFSLITAAQALLKRAEMNADYDGMESGVVIKNGDGGIEYREGDLVLDGETLVGGWARCFRKSQSKPSFDSLKLSTFNTNKSRWAKDPAGMIVKCAESSVLRKSFPTQLGGLYTREEMDHLSQGRIDAREAGSVAGTLKSAASLDELAERVGPASIKLESPPAKKFIEADSREVNPQGDSLLPDESSPTAAKWIKHANEAADEMALDAILAEFAETNPSKADEKAVCDAIAAKRFELRKKK